MCLCVCIKCLSARCLRFFSSCQEIVPQAVLECQVALSYILQLWGALVYCSPVMCEPLSTLHVHPFMPTALLFPRKHGQLHFLTHVPRQNPSSRSSRPWNVSSVTYVSGSALALTRWGPQEATSLCLVLLIFKRRNTLDCPWGPLELWHCPTLCPD